LAISPLSPLFASFLALPTLKKKDGNSLHLDVGRLGWENKLIELLKADE
jgi:hypothetical protein